MAPLTNRGREWSKLFFVNRNNYIVNLKLSFNGSPTEMVLIVGDMSLKYVVQKGKVRASVFKNGMPS